MTTTMDQIDRAMHADPNFHPICVFRAAVLRDIEAREGCTLNTSEIMARFSIGLNAARHTRHGVSRLEAAA